MTSDNGRPVLLASRMNPDLLLLNADERPKVMCSDCRTWRPWKRGQVIPHPAWPGADAPKCAGSHQRVRLDLTPQQWKERLAEAVADAGSRRSARQHFKAQAPIVPSVHQIACAREKALAAAAS